MVESDLIHLAYHSPTCYKMRWRNIVFIAYRTTFASLGSQENIVLLQWERIEAFVCLFVRYTEWCWW